MSHSGRKKSYFTTYIIHPGCCLPSARETTVMNCGCTTVKTQLTLKSGSKWRQESKQPQLEAPESEAVAPLMAWPRPIEPELRKTHWEISRPPHSNRCKGLTTNSKVQLKQLDLKQHRPDQTLRASECIHPSENVSNITISFPFCFSLSQLLITSLKQTSVGLLANRDEQSIKKKTQKKESVVFYLRSAVEGHTAEPLLDLHAPTQSFFCGSWSLPSLKRREK